MRILHTVESYDPAIGGMQEVVKRLSELLVKQGQDVTVATRKHPDRIAKEINGVKIQDFDVRGNEVYGYHGTDIEKYKKYILDSDFDVIVNFAAQQWASDLCYDLLPKIKAKKIFVPTGFSGLYEPIYETYFEKLPHRMKNYDAHIFLSDEYRDIMYARSHRLKNLYLIPNGASYEEFTAPTKVDIRQKLGIPKENFLVIHVGSHTGAKGHRAAINAFRLSKIDNATFLLIGNPVEGGCEEDCQLRVKMANKLPAVDTTGGWKAILISIIKRTLRRQIFRKHGKNKNIILASHLTREETVAAYHAADLFLFPSIIECSPIVFFECMASKTPFLSTKVGNASEIVRWSGGGEILPTRRTIWGIELVIDWTFPIIEKYFRDADLRKKMAESGHRAWLKDFTWEHIAQQYLQLYSALAKEQKPEAFNPGLQNEL